MKPPLVSAVIPVFNRAWCIRRSVESVFSQTYRPIELVVVDDGSTDETRALLQELRTDSAARQAAMTLLRQDRGGVSSARNAGIAAARGELVALLDSDDAWLPGKIERQAEMMIRHPDLMLCHTTERWIRDGREVSQPGAYRRKAGDLFEQSLAVCAIGPSTAMIRRSLFDRIGGFDESLVACEDYDFWLRATALYPVGLVDEPLVEKHGGHPDQLSATSGPLDRFRIRSLAKILDSDVLSPAQKGLAQRALRAKCDIYAQGCEKRGRSGEAAEVRALARRWV